MASYRGVLTVSVVLAILILLAHSSPLAMAEGGLPQAQPPGATIRFAHLTTEDGLSQSVVTAILQDSRGFMWIGTESGLNRFDGYEFTVYQHDPQDLNSLSNNHVTVLYEDADGMLWIATHGGGVNRFDPSMETFTRYQRDPENPNSIAGDVIFSIFQDSGGDFWFGGPPLQGGFSRLDPDTQAYRRYARETVLSEESQGGAVWGAVEDADGDLWLAADFALAELDPETGQYTNYTPDTDDRRLAAIHSDGNGVFWVGGSEGLYRFDPQTGDFALHQPGRPVVVDSILPNDDGTFWIGTLGDGLYLFDPDTGQFLQHHTSDPLVEPSLGNDRVEALYRDRAGVLWVGTAKGLDRYDPRQSQFVYYAYEAENPNSLADGIVWGMCGEIVPEPEMWIGTGMTLNQLRLASDQVTRYPLVEAATSSPTPASTGALYCDPDGFVWAGFGGMLYRLDKTSGEVTSYDVQTISPPGAPPLDITAFYRSGPVLWIGALRGGLIRFDMQNETFQARGDPPSELRGQGDPRFLPSHEVSTIYGDRDGFIWVGYATGELSRFDPDTDTFTHYHPGSNDPHSIPTEWITDIHRDQAGVLWLTARNGLARFDPLTEAFALYTERDGLPKAFVTGIQQDRDGDLWLATMKGLSQFDSQDDTFRNYDLADGVGSTEFLGSSWQRQDGQLFFGGSDGLTAFYPDQVAVNPYQPQVVLTELRLDNQPVAPGADTVLERAIWDTERLVLSHDDDLVSFAFAALSYAAPHKHRYRYRLEGLEADWVTVDSRHRFATYTHLPAGDYVFHVQGTNDGGVWSAHKVALPLTVLPAWWETWWFQGGVVGLLVGLVAVGVRWRVRDLAQRGRVLEAEVAERTRELATRTERLQESEERFATVMNSMQSMMYVADIETYELLFINQTARDIFGDVEGDICWQVLQKGQTGPCDFCTNEHLMKDGRPTGIYTWEFQNTATGRWYYIQDRAIRWIDGRWVRLEVATDITDRKQVERELEESGRRFKEMTDLLPNAVVEMDKELGITYVNQSGLELFGYTEQDVQAGLNAMDLLHPEDRQRARQRIANHSQGKYVPPTEYHALKKDGTAMPVLLNAAPIRREGQVSGFRASITDISKLKEVERSLRESEQQLRFITDSVPAYVAYVGLDDLRYRFVNNKFEEAYGMPRDRIIGQHIKDIIGESNYQFALEYIDVVRSGRGTSYENVFETAQGKRWIEVNYVPTFDEWGEVEGIAVLSFDVTNRKRAEEALRESQEQFALFMDMLPHGVFIKEEDSTVIYVNQYIKDLFGGEHWIGRDAYAAFPDDLALAEAMTADDKSALAEGQTRVEESMPDKDGNEHVFVTTKFRIPRANKPPLLGGIGLDITDRVKAERELAAALDTARRLRDEAEAANRAKSVFLANMSHELRTPLNAILGYSQLMVRDPQLTPTQQEYLETIARSGEHLLGLINDVLTMSTIEAGRTTLQENGFDLHRQLHGLQEMFQMRAESRGLALLLDIAPDVPRYVYADEGKLRQVLMNLLSNAVKFTEAGGVTMRVRVEDEGRKTKDERSNEQPAFVGRHRQSTGASLVFEVEDTGVGIAPEEMNALFDPFVQTASGQRSHEGTGLGLPISQQFVDLMGGELGVKSIVDQGTTFCVRIPVALVGAGTVEALDLQPQRRVTGIEPGQTAPDGGPFRLLVVEDKLTNRELLINLLVPFGFEVRYAVNGTEGVEMWEAWQPHLVWMDIRMPVMDGHEATRQIKARAAATGRSVIVVALTASAFEEDREAILASGCDGFVRKPFREREIFDALHRYLGVCFIYETVTPVSEVAGSVSLEDLRADVETLPAAWAADLYQAIVILDADQMLTLIETIRPQAPHLADTLVQWVRNFEYEKLMDLAAPEGA